MAIQILYHATIGQLEVRGSALPIKNIRLVLDGEVFAIYGEQTISTPLLGKKREGTTDAFAPLPLSDALSASRVECVLVTESGEQAFPVVVSDLIKQPSALDTAADGQAATPEPVEAPTLAWHEQLKELLQEIPYNTQQSAERLGLVQIDWDSLRYVMPLEDYTRLIFRLVLQRECKDTDIEHYAELSRNGTNALDLARRAINGKEAHRLDLTHLGNTAAVKALLEHVAQTHAQVEGASA